MLGQATHPARALRARAQIIRNPAQPRQSTQLHRGTEPVLGPHRPSRAKPDQVVAGQRVKKVTRSSSAISSGQLLSLASSASDRNRTGMRHAIRDEINAVQDGYLNRRRPPARGPRSERRSGLRRPAIPLHDRGPTSQIHATAR